MVQLNDEQKIQQTGAVIRTDQKSKRAVPSEEGTTKASGSKSRGMSRALADMSTDEKTGLISTLKSAITAIKTTVDASNTLITALDPSTSSETEVKAAIASYEAIAKSDLGSYTRTLITKLNA